MATPADYVRAAAIPFQEETEVTVNMPPGKGPFEAAADVLVGAMYGAESLNAADWIKSELSKVQAFNVIQQVDNARKNVQIGMKVATIGLIGLGAYTIARAFGLVGPRR